MFVEELLGLIDLGGQVRATTTIGVIEKHQLAVLLAHLLLVQAPFSVRKKSISPSPYG